MSISIRTIATFAVAILFGIVAVALTRSYLGSAVQQNAAPTATTGDLVPVVVAAQPLARGVVLQPTFLKVVNFPADAVPANAFRAIADLTGDKDHQRLAMRPLVAGEPILANNVSGPGGRLNLSGTIVQGMRGVSIRSNDVAGVGGFVLPGDRVDVILTRSITVGGASNTNTIAQVLAENARVLGVDQSDNDQADKPAVSRAITVEVTPDQAQSISLASAVGTVSLALRRVADDAPLARKSMDVSDLAGSKPRAATGLAGPSVRVFRGTEASRFSMTTAGALQSAAATASAGTATP